MPKLSTIRISSVLLAFTCSLASPITVAGQFIHRQSRLDSGQDSLHAGSVVEGRISGEYSLSGCIVELFPLGGGERIRVAPSWNGSFEFRGVPPGEHGLRVINAKGHVLHDEIVSIRQGYETLSIRLRAEDAYQRGQAETISMQQLQHKSPRKALREFNKGRAALLKQQFTRSVDHLKSALAVDPAFADAHNDLGLAYFQLEKYEQSAQHFQKAIDLAPTHQQANHNLCFVLLKTGRFAEAGQAADRMLTRGGGSPMAHYAAAIGLLFTGGSRYEVLNHLRRAEGLMPKVRLVAARVLAEAGRRADAAREIEAYLRSPEENAGRPELEAWLAELRR